MTMVASAVRSRGMAKRPAAAKAVGGDDDEVVRYTAMMPKSVRRRLKSFCTLTDQKMEVVGAQWIAERLATEEKRLPRAG